MVVKYEKDSERLVTDLQENKISMDIFLKEFKIIRKNYHLGQARLERLNAK